MSLKNKYIALVLIAIGVIVVGRTLIQRRAPGAGDGVQEGDYEDLESNILDLIDDMDSASLEDTGTDDILTIEPFELDPEDEGLGEIY